MRSLKKFLSVCLSVAMLVTSLTVTPVFAAGGVCKIGTTEYSSLSDAVASATAGDTITLIADAELNARLSVDINLTITDDGTERNIYLYNTSTGSAGGYGRGFQVGKSATLTIKGSAGINIYGHSPSEEIFNRGTAVVVNKGSFIAENVDFISCKNTYSISTTNVVNGGAILVGYSADSSLTLSNVTFDGCYAENGVGDDVYSNPLYTNTITLKNKVVSSDFYIPNGKTITLDSTYSTDSSVTLNSDALTIGTVFVTGSGLTAATGKTFAIKGNVSMSIDSTGAIYAKPVCKIGTTEYTTLADAVATITSNSLKDSKRTIILIDDAEITSMLQIKYNAIIKDDGNARTIYCAIPTSDGESIASKAIYKTGSSSTLTITGTSLGKLNIVGHSADGSVDNYGPMVCAYNSTITMTNVALSDSKSNVNGGAVYANNGSTITLNNCTITGCSTSKYGSAIFSAKGTTTGATGATVKINNGTQIYGNSTTNKNGAAIQTSSGFITLNGNLNISGNTRAGAAEDILLDSNTALTLAGSVTGTVYVDYPSAEYLHGVFGKAGSKTYGATGIFAQNNSKLSAAVNSTRELYWVKTSYSVDFGDATDAGQSYTYAAPTVVTPADGAKAVSITVDTGSLAVDWTKLSGIETAYSVDTNYACEETQSTAALKGISVTFTSNANATKVADLIKAITFTADGNTAQKVSLGMTPSIEAGEKFFENALYSYVNDSVNWNKAQRMALSENETLASISDRAVNAFIASEVACGDAAWLGLTQTQSAWYWTNGTQISANATTSEGYQGAFVNWASGNPANGGMYGYITGAGTWATDSKTATRGYILEDEMGELQTATHAITATETKLVSMTLSFDGDISMYYFFSFASNVADDYSVSIVAGSGDDTVTATSTVAEMKNLTDADGNYGIKIALPAKMMGANVYAKLCNSTGGAIKVYGNYSGTNTAKNYNPLYYAKYMINGGFDRYNSYFSSDLISMVKAMLNYGAAAQTQFGYDASNLVNAGYEDSSATTTASSIKGDVYNQVAGKVTVTGVALAASSVTSMRLILAGADANTTATVDGEAVALTNIEGNYYIDIPVLAQDFAHQYSIIISGGTTVTLNEKYVLKQILAGSDAAAKNTADKLYKFGTAAEKYVGPFEQTTTTQEAVLQIAYAILEKEAYTQYDMKEIDGVEVRGVSQSRREINFNLEDTNAYDSTYIDCSSFCYSIYRMAFGESNALKGFLMSGARDKDYMRTSYLTQYPNSSALVKEYNDLAVSEWYNNDTDTATARANWEATIADAKEIMLPGDLLVYYGVTKLSDGGGHILMWTGNGFIHCTGSSYNWVTSSSTDKTIKDRVEPNGSVHYVSSDAFTYSYFENHGAQTAVILRPLNVLSTSDLTSYATARTQLGSLGIDATGYDDTQSKALYDGQSVVAGDTVTYSVNLDNKDLTGFVTSTKVVDVSYTAPSGMTVASASEGGVISGNTITWSNVTIDVNESLALTFTATVTGAAGDLTDGGSGSVALSKAGASAVPITFSAEKVEINTAVSSTVINNIKALSTNYENYNESSVTAGAVIENLKTVLSACGVDTSDIASTDVELFDSIYNTSSLGNYSIESGNAWERNMVSNFVGGAKFFSRDDGDDFCIDKRQRNLEEENLQIGDVIATFRKSSGLYDYYIYIGNNKLMEIANDGTTALKEISTQATSGSTINDTGMVANFLQRSTFVVLRYLGR